MGEGKRGSPFLYRITGSLVRSISSEPENQNQKNTLTNYNNVGYSGSQDLAKNDSSSEDSEERLAIMEAEKPSEKMQEVIKNAEAILGAQVVKL